MAAELEKWSSAMYAAKIPRGWSHAACATTAILFNALVVPGSSEQLPKLQHALTIPRVLASTCGNKNNDNHPYFGLQNPA